MLAPTRVSYLLSATRFLRTNIECHVPSTLLPPQDIGSPAPTQHQAKVRNQITPAVSCPRVTPKTTLIGEFMTGCLLYFMVYAL